MPAHDNAYKNIFSHPQVVADLLTGFVAQDWVCVFRPIVTADFGIVTAHFGR
jgi:hypothetical protein